MLLSEQAPHPDFEIDAKLKHKSVKLFKGFEGKKTIKIHSGFTEYLFCPSRTMNSPISKYDKIVLILKDIRSKTDADGNILYKDYQLNATGHSLGGALATCLIFALAGLDPIEDLPHPMVVISYGSPPVGNGQFLKKFKLFERRNNVQHIRVTSDLDIIPCFLPQSGVSVHLYGDEKAKVKYARQIDYRSRTARAMAKLHPSWHYISTYAERLELDINSDLVRQTPEQLYVKSGAMSILHRRRNIDRLVRKASLIFHSFAQK